VEEKASFSKKINRIIDLHEYKNLETGTKVHQALERLDFINPNFNILDLDNLLIEKIKTFLNSKLLENLNQGKVYKEYSFYDFEDNIEGIIDLMIDYPGYIDIIDYKLNNLDDESYLKQLTGYRNFIEKKTNKVVNIYLYSLLEEKYIQL
jgi:ATP-dependent exoDNAse (exonuclease V) beta subunit